MVIDGTISKRLWLAGDSKTVTEIFVTDSAPGEWPATKNDKLN